MRIRNILAGIACLMASAVGAHAATPQVLSHDGHEVDVFIAGPVDANAAILLVHDWFGPSAFYEEAANRLGALGYRVMAVDLYSGASGTTHAEAWALMQALDGDTVNADLDAALAALHETQDSVAVMAFSMGVDYARNLAVRAGGDVDAFIAWYGDTSLSADDAAMVTAPVLGVYGSLDGPAAEQAAALSQILDANSGAAETYVYPGAHHAFAQPLFNAGETYDPAAAEAAWAVTENFLSRRLAN